MENILTQTRTCTKCGKTKPVSEFHKSKQVKSGLRADCKVCCSERGVEERERNKEHYRQYRKQHYETHRESVIAQAKEWYENNKEKHRQSCIKYRIAHREKTLESSRKATKKWMAAHPEHKNSWRAKNPNKGAEYMRTRKARLLGVGGIITAKEWEDLKNKYGNKCLSCGRTDVKLHLDHVNPVSMGGSNTIDNAQPLCKSCNSAKHTRNIDYRPF